jgi:hypothetical protein
MDGQLQATQVKDIPWGANETDDESKAPICRTEEVWTLSLEKKDTIVFPSTTIPIDCDVYTGNLTSFHLLITTNNGGHNCNR